MERAAFGIETASRLSLSFNVLDLWRRLIHHFDEQRTRKFVTLSHIASSSAFYNSSPNPFKKCRNRLKSKALSKIFSDAFFRMSHVLKGRVSDSELLSLQLAKIRCNIGRTNTFPGKNFERPFRFRMFPAMTPRRSTRRVAIKPHNTATIRRVISINFYISDLGRLFVYS